MRTLPSAAVPAQPKNTSQPEVFDWYENKVQQCFQKLHDVDLAGRPAIIETIKEMQNSGLFHKLLVKYTDTADQARKNEDYDRENDAIFALCARCYIAGSLRDCRVIDNA